MLRLRTTTGLSALALAIGVAGTGWLSTLTVVWPGPAQRLAATRQGSSMPPRALPSLRHRQRPLGVVQMRRADADRSASDMGEAQAAAPAPELVPLAMPGDTSQSWDELRGHLDGHVVLHVGVDGNGRVLAASLVESSGDPVLDEHALRSVRGWRFAVPGDHPDGISGDLPMRFSAQGERIAQSP